MQELNLTKLVDLVDVPEEDFDHFVEDLKTWLAGVKLFNAIGAELKDSGAVEMSETMRWINDGKHDIDINIQTKG